MTHIYFCEQLKKRMECGWLLKAIPILALLLTFQISWAAPMTVTGVSSAVLAIPGETCENPMDITVLPFNHTGSTGDYGNVYGTGDVPADAPGVIKTGTGSNSYMLGFEAVYAITPSIDGEITINVNFATSGWNAIWAFSGCPFSLTHGIHTNTSGTARSIANMPVTAFTTYYIVVSNWDPPSVDYTIDVTGTPGLLAPLEDCTGTPDGGTASVNPSSGNPGSSYTVKAAGFTFGTGLSYQWESDSGSGWTARGDATTSYQPFSTTAQGDIGTTIDWRLKITCTLSSQTAYSTVATFTTEKVYCIPSATTATRFINNFSTTGGGTNISNLGSGFSAGGYGDFYDTHSVAQSPGGDVSFNTDVSGGTAGFRIWVDWNQNGTFESNEVVFASTGYANSHNGSFTVPAGALTGDTRMRVVSHWSSTTGDVSPCATGFTNGEFEDYKFTVVGLNACSGTPDAGSATVNPTSGNPDSTYTVNASGFTLASGLSFQWESKVDGGNWTAQGDASSTYENYTATAQGPIGTVTEWRLKITCTGSNESAYSSTATFTTELTYCNAGAGTVEAITRIIFADVDHASPTTGAPAYEDFTAIVAHVEAGQTYTMKAEGNTDGNFTNYFVAWIDWNKNGTFEDNEKTVIGSIINSNGADGQQAINDITVPADAIPGTTRMRIIKNFNAAASNPCGNVNYGQVEDYTVEVGGGTDPFPSPYCNIEDGDDVIVEEITKIEFAGTTITNDNSTDVLINKTDVVVDVTTNGTYTLSVEGNTYGDFETNIVAFIDWNQNGILDDAGEIYELGTLEDTDGTDGVAVSMDIQVPADAVLGNTRIRITKTYFDFLSAAIVNPCGIQFDPFGMGTEAGFGQALDFTLNVEEGTLPPGDECSFGDITTTSFDNAFNIEAGNDFHTAAGFVVEEGVTFTLNTITLDVNQQEVPNNAIIKIHQGNNPGNVIETITMAPTSSNAYGTAFGDPVYHLTFDLAASVELTEGTYWVDAKMSTPSNETVWLLASANGSNPVIPQRSTDGGATWNPSTDGLYVIFSVSGECEDSGVTPPGDDCSLSAASNNFENGASLTKAGNRIVAQDVVVAAGKDMLLENLEVSLLMGGVGAGINAQNVDVIIYENDNGMPGTVVTTLTDVVPTSQVTNGDAFNFQAWMVDIPVNIELEGDSDNATTYWVGLSVLTTDASNVFWEFSTAAVVGLPQAYFDGTVWASQAGREGVYTFNATCTDHDGGTPPGDDCSFGDITTTSFDNAFNIEAGNDFHTAAGFVVEADVRFTMNTITIDVNQQEVPNNATIKIHQGNNPGNVIETITMAPTSSNIYGSAFGDPVYHLTFDLPAPIVLNEGNYWIDAKMSTPSGETVWWLASANGSNPVIPQRSTDGGVTWTPATDGLYMIFSVSGSCEDLIGIEDHFATGFTYYPNPVESVLNLKSDVRIDTVSGYNVLGQLVITNKQFNNGQVDVSALPTGAYLFRVTFENGMEETFRVLKK